MAEEKISYDKMVIGRYASILTKNSKICNEKLAQGMSMEEFIEFDYKFHEYHSHASSPHLVVEYLVDGKLYYRALEYPRSSPIIQKNYFGKEVIVTYKSDNPWYAVVRTDLKIDKVKADEGLESPDYSCVEALDNMEYYGLNFLKDGKSYVSTPLNVEKGSSKKEKKAFLISLLSLLPPILGTASWVMTIIAFVMAIKAEKEEEANHSVNRNTLIVSVVALVLSPIMDMIYLFAIITVLAKLIEILNYIL